MRSRYLSLFVFKRKISLGGSDVRVLKRTYFKIFLLVYPFFLIYFCMFFYVCVSFVVLFLGRLFMYRLILFVYNVSSHLNTFYILLL